MYKNISILLFSYFLSAQNTLARTVISGEVNGTVLTGEANDPAVRSITLDNPLGNNIQDIPSLVESILNIALTIGVPIIALAIIYSGFKFIAAQGNPEKLKEAKQTILYVLIGAGILLAAYAIATAVVDTITAIRG